MDKNMENYVDIGGAQTLNAERAQLAHRMLDPVFECPRAQEAVLKY